MCLVKIDVIGVQALQRTIDGAADVLGRQTALARPHLQAHLGGDEYPRAHRRAARGEPGADHSFGLATLMTGDEAYVGIRGVDHVEAGFDEGVEQSERALCIGSPAEYVAAENERGQFECGVAEAAAGRGRHHEVRSPYLSRSQRLRCMSSGLSSQPSTLGRTRLRATSSISGTTG